MKSGSGYTTDHQKTWRKIASVSLLLSGAMAVYAVVSSIARDTLIHFARAVSGAESDLTPTLSVFVCLVFWSVLGALLMVTSYIALLDMRFIRLQYALEKRALLAESWGDDEFREMLRKTWESHRDTRNPEPADESPES